MMTQARTLIAKFKSQCVICGQTIRPGSKILYQQGKGSWHLNCDGNTPVAVNSRIPEQKISADADLAALAGQHGRTIDGEPKLTSLMVSSAKAGDIIKARGRRLLVLAVGESRYYSADYLEDMDMFDVRPGRYSDAQVVAVLPTAEEAEAEQAAAMRKARIVEVERALHASYSSENHISGRPDGITLEQLHGASRMAGSETWYLGSDGAVYYCRSDYDMGPNWWKTTATVELVREAKDLGARA
jgi:hypothetical protein